MSGRAIALWGVAGAIALAAWLALRPEDPAQPRAARAVLEAPQPTAGAAGGAVAGDAAPPTAAPPPHSLRDTEVDGELLTDGAGRFVPTPATLAFFDYFLSASGEEGAASLRARIVSGIEARLAPGVAREEAIALLDRYLGYREAARQLVEQEDLAASADLERRLQWVGELRRAHFGAGLAETLFGDEERAVRIAVERRRIAANPALPAAEKTARLAALEQALPEAMRRARESALAPVRLAEEEEAALRAAAAPEAEIRRLREARVGPAAADRLAELDRRRADWNGRLAAYRAARAILAADPALDAEARDAALARLREERFRPEERLRVEALDRIDAATE